MLRTMLSANVLAAALALISLTAPSAAAPFGIVKGSQATPQTLKLPVVSIHHAPWHTGGRGKHEGWSKGVRGKDKAKGQWRGRR